MFPMGFYDYGYNFGLGMVPSVPPPAVVNHQADENIYVAHHENNDGATIALLSFAALGSLAGLLIAHKANTKTKLIDAVTHELKATAQSGAEDILKAAKDEAHRLRQDAVAYAGNTKDAAHQEARSIVKDAHDDVNAAKDHLAGIISEHEAKLAELNELTAKAKQAGVANPITEPHVVDSKKVITQPGFTEPIHTTTVEVKGKDAAKVAKEAARAAKDALPSAAKFMNDGLALCKESKYTDALPKFLDSVKIYEDNLAHVGRLSDYHLECYSHSLNNAGYCYMQQADKMDEAIKYFEKSIAVVPEKPNMFALANLSDCHRKLGNQGELIKCLKVMSDADNIPASLELGTIKEDQARKILSTTVTNEADVNVNLAKSTELYKESAELYKKAAGKGDAEAKVKLARLFQYGPKDMKNDVEAVKLFKEALADYVKIAESGKDDANVIAQLRSLNVELGGYTMHGSMTPELKNLLVDDKEYQALIEKSRIIAGNGGINKNGKLPDLDVPLPQGKKGKTPGAVGDTSAPTGQFVKAKAAANVTPPNPDMSAVVNKPPATVNPNNVKIGLDETTAAGKIPDTIIDSETLEQKYGEGNVGNIKPATPVNKEAETTAKAIPTPTKAATPQAEISDLPTPVMPIEAKTIGAEATKASPDMNTTALNTPSENLIGLSRPATLPGATEAVAAESKVNGTQTAVDALASRGLSGTDTMVKRPTDTLVAQSVKPDSSAGLDVFDGAQTLESTATKEETKDKMFKTPVSEAEIKAEAAAQAAKNAEEAAGQVGELTKSAINIFKQGRYDEAFVCLKECVDLGEHNSRQALLKAYDVFFHKKDIANEVKGKYIEQAIDSLIDAAKNGSVKMKKGLAIDLEEMLKDKKFGTVDVTPYLEKITEALAATKGITEGNI